MTPDTERAIEIVKPIADELGIKVSATDNHLICEYHSVITYIGITYNSTYATLMEFIGYLIDYYCDHKEVDPGEELNERYHRYWRTAEAVEQIRKGACE